jgi:hypothetical protein
MSDNQIQQRQIQSPHIADTNDVFWALAIALWAAVVGGGSNYTSAELNNISRQVTLWDFLTVPERKRFQSDFNTQVSAVDLLLHLEIEASRTADPSKRYQVNLVREDIASRYEAMASVLEKANPTLSADNPKAAEVAKRLAASMKDEAKQIRNDPSYLPRKIIHPSRGSSVSSNQEEVRSKILASSGQIKMMFGLDVSNPRDMNAAEYLYRKSNNQAESVFIQGFDQPERDAVLRRVEEATTQASSLPVGKSSQEISVGG